MFFVIGISSGRKSLDFQQPIVCSVCGSYGRYEIFMEYMYFSLFFIPIFKWNKTYYVKSSCCGSVYTISRDLGSRIARGESITLQEDDLQPVQYGSMLGRKRCSQCGFETQEDYQYCPKCSNPLY